MTEDTTEIYFDKINAILTVAGIPHIEVLVDMRKSVLQAGYTPTKLLIPKVSVLGMPVEFADVDIPRVEFK